MQTRSKKALTVAEMKAEVEKPEVKARLIKAVAKIKENVPKVIKANSAALKAAYFKQKALEERKSGPEGMDVSAIHKRRDAIKNDPVWIRQKDIFIKNLDTVVNDKKLVDTIKEELKTQSKSKFKSSTLEAKMLEGLDTNVVYIEANKISIWMKLLEVWRLLVPVITLDETEDIAINLKKLMEMNIQGDKTILDLYSDFRMMLKRTFGEEKTYFQSPHFTKFVKFSDPVLKDKTQKAAEDKMMDQPRIPIEYSRVLKAIKKWSENKTDISRDAKLCAIALATGMRDEEILADWVEVKEVKGKPNMLFTKGIAKQRNLKGMNFETTRPIIELTGEKVVEMIDEIRDPEEKKPKLKMAFVAGEFKEFFDEKQKRIDAQDESVRGERVRSILRSIYAEAVSVLPQYNPTKIPQKKLLRDYFGHKANKGTSFWYMDKIEITDDVTPGADGKKKETKQREVKTKTGASDDCCDEQSAEIAMLKKRLEELETKQRTSKTAAYGRKKILTEEELIKKGKKAVAKLGDKMTTRTLRKEMGIGNDKIKWLMQQLGVKREIKPWNAAKTESKEDEEDDEEEDDEEEEPKTNELMKKLKRQPDGPVSTSSATGAPLPRL